MLTLLISYAIIVGILYDYFDNQIKKELTAEAAYIACGMEVVGEEYLEGFRQIENLIKTVLHGYRKMEKYYTILM